MATTLVGAPSVVPSVTLEQTVLTDLHNTFKKVLYAHLGVIVLLICFIAVGGYFGLKSYDKALAHADALQAQFTASQKSLTDLLAQDAQLRTQQSAQEAALVAQVAQRASQAPPPAVTQALQPSASAVDAIQGIQSEFNLQPAPEPLPDEKIALSVPNAQEMIRQVGAGKLAEADLSDETQLYTLEQTKNASLNTDLIACKSTLSECQSTLKAYQNVVKKSRLRRILGGIGRNAERVGILVVGIELGHSL
jgi:hypothetical protein